MVQNKSRLRENDWLHMVVHLAVSEKKKKKKTKNEDKRTESKMQQDVPGTPSVKSRLAELTPTLPRQKSLSVCVSCSKYLGEG